MIKFVSAISILLLAGSGVARAQQMPARVISDADKVGIIESVLDLELRTQASVPDFANIRQVSSDNIEFAEASQLSEHGFTLVAGSQLRAWKKDNVVEYLLFRNMFLRDGVAVVVLSRVTEGLPCFAAAFSRERRYTYQSRRTPVGWIAQLIGRPSPLNTFAMKRYATKR